MRVIAMIPARYAASRLPGKLMKDLGGKPVIVRTFEAVLASQLFEQVYVVTDDDRIEKAVLEAGGAVIRSKKEHPSGSDRLAEACEQLEADVVVNIQGDEPFTETKNLQILLDIFKKDTDNQVDIATLMERFQNLEAATNPNNVKVVVTKNNDALYFSRAFIPFARDGQIENVYFKHIGIYAYRKKALMQFPELGESVLERIEKLEQLRYLENGFKIRLAVTDCPTIGIDTENDLEEARKLWKTKHF